MKTSTLKKTGTLLFTSLLLLSATSSFAQKSIYDVVPGSGPKKTAPVKKNESGLPGIINGKDNDDRRDRPVYHHSRRRNLPPGQAKKIYGGSAKDYAPGQVKKHHHKHKHGHKNGGHHHKD